MSTNQRSIFCATIIIFVLTAFLSGCQSLDGVRPMSEMHGGCENYRLSVGPLLKTADSVNSTYVSSKLANQNDKNITINSWRKVQLFDDKEVKLLKRPGKQFKDHNYSGFISFVAPQDGIHYVGSKDRLWIEVLNGTNLHKVRPDNFEMQSKCAKLFKAVGFKLKKGQRYFVQVSSSKVPETVMFISPFVSVKK